MATMEADRWRRIEEVFHLALQYNDVEREAYLAGMCGEDKSLLDEVRSLISSHELSGEFLDKPQLTAGLQLLAVRNAPSLDGQTIGHYSLKNRIGLGGMGEVYLALDQRLGRNVALKLLPPSFNDHPDWVCRFQYEARAASSIAHPNIAHVYEVGEADGQHYIAMENIEGVTLREYLRRTRLKPLEAIEITIQIARALSAAHSTGMLHRDIKPDNIMIHRDGYVKVLDFGLAKSTVALKSQCEDKGTVSAVETGAGIIVGSPAYMSPEQARGLAVDRRSDLWSLGIVLYELLAQKNPFLSDTPSDTMAAILKTDPPPLGLLVREVSAEIERVITKLLAKEAEDRYQSAESLIADLCNLTEELKHRKTFEHHSEISAGDHGSALVPSSGLNQQRSKQLVRTVASIPAYVRSASKPTKLGLSALLLIALTSLLMLRYPGHSAPEMHASPITSIAVLPFANGNGNPNTEYISDGLSESLIERFSRLSRIKVIARNSSFKYKGKPADLKNIARELGVQALVTGTVTQQGDDLQVSVELTDANRKSQLWIGQYRYKTSDLPIILNDITRKVTAKLNLGLSTEELNLITMDPRGKGDAYEWYLKGRFYWNQLTEEALDKSIDCFNEALAIDPQYALAYTGLANSYIVLGANYRPPQELFRQAELNAQKGLEIDENLAEAHYTMAATRYLYYWDLSGAEKELKRSLELNPNYAMANSMLSSVSLTRGDTKQAAVYIDRALKPDPLSLLFNTRLSSIYYFQRDNERAIKLAQKLLSENDNAFFLYNTIAIAYAQMKSFKEALAASQRASILMREDAVTISTLGVIYALSGRVKEARWVAETLEQLSKKRYVQPYLIASIYGALGDKNQAFTWLEKAARQRDSYMLRIRVDPAFDKIHSDLRYDRLLQSVNLG
jgi:serine/threonine protein kinase/tetratricopeptide (TPR) repeat protein